MLKVYPMFYATKTMAEEVEVVARTPEDALMYLESVVKEKITDYEFLDRAIFKFNDGRLALLCSACKTIIKEGKDFTHPEMEYVLGKSKYLSPLYCDSCKIEKKSLTLPLNEN